jgi:hypothetical protein
MFLTFVALGFIYGIDYGKHWSSLMQLLAPNKEVGNK